MFTDLRHLILEVTRGWAFVPSPVYERGMHRFT
jgi:hypothetical protein